MNNNLKGILLAAGKGTRLMPASMPLSKPLLPLYDKPMIYYPLETLIRIGVKDILFIVQEEDIPVYKNVFGNGEDVGLNFYYEVQQTQRGISDAYVIAENFLNSSPSVLALCDNVFLGINYFDYAKLALDKMIKNGASIFAIQAENPKKFGVIELDKNENIVGIEEKPEKPKSNLVIPGMYFFDKEATELVKQIKPSKRGELEITDLIKLYLKNKKLGLQILDNSIKWHDTGNSQAMIEASISIRNYEKENKLKIGLYEIAAFEMGFIDKKQLLKLAQKFNKSDYGKFIVEYSKNY
ncbi:MAG: glucose-1-phosphate thymidylyltransferase [Pelagibacteraceae bacterium]|jgi:glucose-1-phosphate thymidylyltransferase|nr:glucose-1-phosphate thymidylyltransferase [Pelagibacteraceae bacterium]|tara:strand:- start:3175 stop:4062 length:888 start_codon:yes stop_codon:yes gene_type:complete